MIRMFVLALAFVAIARSADSLAASPSASDKDPTDPATRYQKHTVGDKPEDWAQHLNDAAPNRRLEALKLLGDSLDPKATRYLMEAVQNADPRISMGAVDFLGRSAAPEAAELLSEQLLRPDANPTMRRHILVALGKIADPTTGHRVMDFLASSTDADLRATAIFALGEIGDAATRGQLQGLSDRETDPRMKILIQDAAARIGERQLHPGPTHKGGTAVFTRSEGAAGSTDSVR